MPSPPVHPTPPQGDNQGRSLLQETFHGKDSSTHGSLWDGLWRESQTPWDRRGPSPALDELLVEHAELVSPPSRRSRGETSTRTAGSRPRALVPGCGRGYDVLLLSAHGFDVWGLDFSPAAVDMARENEHEARGSDVYAPRNGVDRGEVTWVAGDFFDATALSGQEGFDLIYDYTFLCALPPNLRPEWAKRVAHLLNPEGGRLVCLEWPLHKDPSSGGPPWGLTHEIYAAHLARPGQAVTYDSNGLPLLNSSGADGGAPNAGLDCVLRLKPRHTHEAGVDGEGGVIDFISVWGRWDSISIN